MSAGTTEISSAAAAPAVRSNAVFTRFAPLVGLGASIAAFTHVLVTVSTRIVNPDASVLWYEASEWAAGRFHEPGFFGQAYGTSLAGIPVALLHELGLSYATAAPVALALSTLGMWIALGLAAWRRGHPALATAAFGAPAVLSAYYTMYTSSVTFERSFVVGGVAAALFILGPRLPFQVVGAVSLAGLAIAFDNSAALLVVPVVLWWMLDDAPQNRNWRAIGVGLLVPAAYWIGATLFYRAHRDYNTHRLGLQPRWSTFERSIRHPGVLFRLFAPELLRAWWLPVVVALVLCALLLSTRRARYLVPGVLVAVLTLVAMASPRADAGSAFFLPPARILLLLPPAIWFCAYLVALARPAWARTMGAAGMAAVLALALTGVVLQFASSSHDPAELYRAAISPSQGYGFTTVASQRRSCAELDARARRADADVVITFDGAGLPLACEAQHRDALHSIDVPAERRTWVLARASRAPVRAALLHPVDRDFCARAAPRFEDCKAQGSYAVVRFQAQPPLNVLALLDQPVRAFGPGCEVGIPYCEVGTDRRLAFPLPIGDVTPPSAEWRGMEQALEDFARDGARSGEPSTNDSATIDHIASVVRARGVAIRSAYRIGPRTFAAELDVPSAGGRHVRMLGQLVRDGSRFVLAASTQCAIGLQNGILCAFNGSQLLGGIWRTISVPHPGSS